MHAARVLVIAVLLALPAAALADTYQLWLEMFDETRSTTVCRYRSGEGKQGSAEYAGRQLCPRVACEIPPGDGSRLADTNCEPGDVAPLS